MVLDRPRAAETELLAAALVAGDLGGSRGWLGEAVPVPLEGQAHAVHLVPADLGLWKPPHRCASDLGDELGSEADTQDRRAGREQAGDPRLLLGEPAGRVVDACLAAEDHRRVVAVRPRSRPLAEAEARDLVVAAEDARPGVLVVDEGEDGQAAIFSAAAPSSDHQPC